ncbi:hypothetical protein [Stratiformator vulcanicus]|uniref:Uncharacterized protein n=1 Tax=Stratiformator vulcanicus TaxID=2527980 RepID=A0A517QWI2_9PLAN|nr:hypothetical protein [Stratiformator vulcanicus]QDT35930.1 hypothetical protein Pan189_02830 [Stratiformator vulcanicus]
MNYDVSLWYSDRLLTAAEAEDVFGRLIEGDPTAAPGFPGVAAFFRELTSRYPPLEDCPAEAIGDYPWAAGPTANARLVSVSIRFAHLEEIYPALIELAAKHDLVMFDPQIPDVIDPPRLAAMPRSRLIINDERAISNATDEQIAEALGSMKNDPDSFVIYELRDGTYFQAAIVKSNQYVVEYQVDNLDNHFQAFTTDLATLTTAFQEYARDDPAWRERYDWQKLEL